MLSLQVEHSLLYAIVGRLPLSHPPPDQVTQLLALSPHSSWLEPTVLGYYLAGRGNELIFLLNLDKMRAVGKIDDMGATKGGDGR